MTHLARQHAARTLLAAAFPLLVAAASANAAPPSLRHRLVRALTSGEQAELDRVANIAGVGWLRGAIVSDDRPLQQAAIAAAPGAAQPWILLPTLVQQMGARDRAVAVAAARAARRIAEGLRLERLLRFEHPPELLLPSWTGLLAIVGAPQMGADVRTIALLTLAQLRDVMAVADKSLLPLLRHRDQRLRRAAVQLFAAAPTAAARAALVRLIAADPAPAVARAAAAAFCATAASRHKSTAQLAALRRQAAAVARLRRLVDDAAATRDELHEFARCLGRLGADADRRARRRALRRLGRR